MIIVSRFLLLFLAIFSITACSHNPVTGKNELQLISASDEIAMGNENYIPMQQSEGGTYDLDEALTAYVSQVGHKLASVSNRQLPYEFVIINNSVPNAWALPGGKIAINRGLLIELDNEAELAAVLGHEIVHAAARHSANQMQTNLALGVGLLVIAATQEDTTQGQATVAAGTVGALMLSQKYSRDAESEADKYGMQYMARAGYDPQAAVTLQETFVRLSKGNNPNWLEGLFSSHPPSEERVTANRARVKSLTQPNLTLGRARYQRHIAGIIKNKPAYDQYADAAKATRNKNYGKALHLIDQAIRQEPREGLFYALKGEIYDLQGSHQRAIREYDKAVSKKSDLYYFYLKRGLSYKNIGNYTKARLDLERSLRLLPTKEAREGLKILN